MVEVIYDGNLGNNLFQYCFGRILAEKLGYCLNAQPISGFPGTYDRVSGHDNNGARKVIVRGQKVDAEIFRPHGPPRHIVLTGYFQRAEYYIDHQTEIRRWLRLPKQTFDRVSPTDLVMGVRRGRDYIPQHGLPLSFYEDALRLCSYDNLFICTNDASDRFVQYLASKYGATVRPPNPLDNFAFIGQFRHIIISNSTFLWWAAFLSDANQIIVPRPQNGFWSQNDPVSRDIQLEIADERYHYLPAAAYKPEFLGEKIQGATRALCLASKRLLQNVVPGLRRTPPRPRYNFTAE